MPLNSVAATDTQTTPGGCAAISNLEDASSSAAATPHPTLHKSPLGTGREQGHPGTREERTLNTSDQSITAGSTGAEEAAPSCATRG